MRAGPRSTRATPWPDPEPYFATVELLDGGEEGKVGWCWVVDHGSLTWRGLHGTSPTFDEALADIRRGISRKVDIDEEAIDLQTTALVSEPYARIVEAARSHNAGGDRRD